MEIRSRVFIRNIIPSLVDQFFDHWENLARGTDSVWTQPVTLTDSSQASELRILCFQIHCSIHSDFSLRGIHYKNGNSNFSLGLERPGRYS